jgi:hypothetical protein
MNTLSNVLVAVISLALITFFGWEAVADYVTNAPDQTIAYAGFGGVVVAIVGVGSALLSPRRM